MLEKFDYAADTDFEYEFSLDPRLERRSSEKLIAKPYDSAFKGTNLAQMLSILRIDTLIVTGCSTGHCIYATCRDAVENFHLIVPAEAVGDRSELMHEVTLFDIDIAMGDVMRRPRSLPGSSPSPKQASLSRFGRPGCCKTAVSEEMFLSVPVEAAKRVTALAL